MSCSAHPSSGDVPLLDGPSTPSIDRRPTTFLDLPDDILREIADHLAPPWRPLPSFRSPVYEAPKPIDAADEPTDDDTSDASGDAALIPATLPGPSELLSKDLRSLRAVCRRARYAIAPEVCGIEFESRNFMKRVRRIPRSVAFGVRTVDFMIPWSVGAWSECPTGQSTSDNRCGAIGCGPAGAQRLLAKIVRSLKILKQVQHIRVSSLPPAGEQHSSECYDILEALWRVVLDGVPAPPRLKRLASLEISDPNVVSCAFCTDVIIVAFRRYLPQCDFVKLGASPLCLLRPDFTVTANARSLMIRADREDVGPQALLQSLMLSKVFPFVRTLVLHSTQHFIELQCPEDGDGPIRLTGENRDVTFEQLLELLRPWRSVEELDFRVMIAVPVSEAVKGTDYYDYYRHHHDPEEVVVNKDELDDLLGTYAKDVLRWPTASQVKVLQAFADVLPNLETVWLWTRIPPPEGIEACDMRRIQCRRWNSGTAFRIRWNIDRSGESPVFRRSKVFDAPNAELGQSSFEPSDTESDQE